MTDQIPIPDYSLVDFERWGRLIMTWATGESYFLEPHAPPGFRPKLSADDLPRPQPGDRAEFERQCKLAQTGFIIPAGRNGFQLNPAPLWDQFYVDLPPKSRITQFQDLLKAEDPSLYRFVPSFYSRYVGKILQPNEKCAFQACRIGDYSINFCG
jgi:hypothetical protein